MVAADCVDSFLLVREHMIALAVPVVAVAGVVRQVVLHAQHHLAPIQRVVDHRSPAAQVVAEETIPDPQAVAPAQHLILLPREHTQFRVEIQAVVK
jgi:hypothetical protein